MVPTFVALPSPGLEPLQSGALDQTDREVQHDSCGVHALSGWIMGGTRFFASASTRATWSGGRPVIPDSPRFGRRYER